MFLINEAYGNAAALRKYCGVNQFVPIWGEIQHSLWVNDHIVSKNKRSRLFPILFAWNKLLEIRTSVAIGDPMLYLAKRTTTFKAERANQAIGLPKFRRNENLDTRIRIYQNFLNYSLEIVAKDNFMLVLHPGETQYAEEIRGKKFEDVVIYSPLKSDNPMKDYFRLLEQSRIVLSDYLGAHTFRSSYFFDSEVHLAPDLWRNPVEIPRISELFDTYLGESSRVKRKLVSRELLGVDYLRSANELRDLLGFTSLKKISGPAINFLYNFRKAA